MAPVWNVRNNFQNVFMKTFMYGMVGSLAMFITSWEQADRIKDNFLDKNRDYGDTYDFIIVGAGNSGLTMANRLSAHYKVLVIEAGGNPHPFSTIPFMSGFMSNYKELDWMHTTLPQKHAFFGSEQNRARISGGLSLGGSSNLEYMINLRGSPHDYDNWASVTGDSSWGYDAVMQHFKKHEKYEGPWKNSKIHGEKGEMRFAIPDYTGLGNKFCKGGKEMGYQHLDLNGHFSEGFDLLAYPTVRGTRQAAFKAFLKPAQDRWNLAVHKYAHVNRILMRGDNEAYAVEYNRHGKTRLAYARKEILLSAGAIQSPKILMHSGIGAKNHLESLGIVSRVDLPSVGQNLQDHMAIHLGPFFVNPKHSLLLDRDMTARSALQYAMGTGPLSSSGYQAAALLTSDLSKINGNPYWPDIQLTLYGMGHHQTADEDFCHAHRFRRDLMKQYYQHSKGRDSFSIVVSAGRPKSRGQITLQDRNPYSKPLIDPKYLEQIEDVGVLIDGIKKSMRLVENTIAFQEIGAKFTNVSVPGCTNYRFRSDDYWSCYVRLMSVSMGDIAGTAAMGQVVTPELNVYGTSRLRIVDASVMPFITSSSTAAATMMIAEKAAAMILDFWGEQDKLQSHLDNRSKVKEILKASSEKLKAMDSSSLFLNNIKHTDSFKDLSSEDVKEALGLNDFENSNGDLYSHVQGSQQQILSSETSNSFKSLRGSNNLNSFKLIGAMLRNSLNPKEPQQNFKTNFVQQNPLHINMFRYNSLPNRFVPSSVPSTYQQTVSKVTPPVRNRIKAPSVDTLFDPSTTTSTTTQDPRFPGYINYPVEEVSFHNSESFKTASSIKKIQDPTDTYTLKPQPIYSSYIKVDEGFNTKPTVTLKDAVESIVENYPGDEVIFKNYKKPDISSSSVSNEEVQGSSYQTTQTPEPFKNPGVSWSYVTIPSKDSEEVEYKNPDISTPSILPQDKFTENPAIPLSTTSTLAKVNYLEEEVVIKNIKNLDISSSPITEAYTHKPHLNKSPNTLLSPLTGLYSTGQDSQEEEILFKNPGRYSPTASQSLWSSPLPFKKFKHPESYSYFENPGISTTAKVPQAEPEILNEVPSSLFKLPKPDPVTLKDAVGSIISKTIPIVRDQPQQSINYYPFTTSPASTTSQPLTFNPRREIPRGFKTHVDGLLNVRPSSLNSGELNKSVSSPSSIFKMSPLQIITSPIRKATEPFRKVFEPLKQMSSPFRKISEPFSKIVSMPFDGFMTRIRRILRPENKFNQISTTNSPKIFKSKLFSSTTNQPTLISFKGFKDHSSRSLNSEVQKILAKSQTISKYLPWTSTPEISSKFENSTNFTSKLRSKPEFQNPNSYKSQETSNNNTFVYNKTEEVEIPPKDYELIDWESESLNINSNQTQNLKKFKSSPPAVQIEKTYKVIYSRPAETNLEKSKPPGLASNVQEILENTNSNSTPFTPKNAPISNQNFNSFYNIDQSKTLDSEIDKLIASQNLTKEVGNVYLLVSNSKENSQNPFRNSLKLSQNVQQTSSDLSKTVYELLKVQNSDNTKEEINNPHKDKDSGLIISTTNLLELNNQKLIQKSKKPKSTTIIKPLSSSKTVKMDFSKWATESPNREDRMSFRIKILNQ